MSDSSVATMKKKAFVFVPLLLAMMAMEKAAGDGVPFAGLASDRPEFEFMHGMSAMGVNVFYSPPANGTVKFGLWVPSGGWVSLGWSPDCEMYSADCVMAGVGEAVAAPATYRTLPRPTYNIESDPELAGRIDLSHAWNSTIAVDGASISFLTVQRSMHGGNVAINRTEMCVIWAYDDTYTAGFHGKKKRGALRIALTLGGSTAVEESMAIEESMSAEVSRGPVSETAVRSAEASRADDGSMTEGSGGSASSPASGSAPAASGSAAAASGIALPGGIAPTGGGAHENGRMDSAPPISGAAFRDVSGPSSAPPSGSTKRAPNAAVSIGVALLVALLTFSAYLLA